MIRHKWVPRGTNMRTCEICGMGVERKPDRRFAWSLRAGKAVLVDGEHVTAGQSPTLKALPGCGSHQKSAPDNTVRPRYGVFLQLRGNKTVQRMTPAGRLTDAPSCPAVFPSEHWAQRRADELSQQLNARHPGIEVWTAPL